MSAIGWGLLGRCLVLAILLELLVMMDRLVELLAGYEVVETGWLIARLDSSVSLVEFSIKLLPLLLSCWKEAMTGSFPPVQPCTDLIN